MSRYRGRHEALEGARIGAVTLSLVACSGFGAEDGEGNGAPPDDSNDASTTTGEDGGIVTNDGTPSLALHVADTPIIVTQGTKAKLAFTLDRTPALTNDAVTITAISPPNISGNVTIGPNAKSGEIELSVASDATQGPVSVTLEANADGKAKATATTQIIVGGPAGTPDATFGNDGVALLPQSVVFPFAFTQPDDTILVGGTCSGSFCVSRYMPDGSLDTAYGMNGVASSAALGGEASAALLPDGKIILSICHQSSKTIRVTRLLANGEVDTSFGVGGIASAPFPVDSGSPGEFSSVAIGPDGTIAVGYRMTRTTPAGAHWAIARFSAMGALVPTTSGFVWGRWADAVSGLLGIGIRQSTGAIFGVGVSSPANGTEVGIFQVTTQHNLDPNFGPTGTGTMSTPLADLQQVWLAGPRGRVVLEQPDGKVVAVTAKLRNGLTDPGKSELFRFLANGRGFDLTFATNGVYEGPVLREIALDSNLRIVAGTASNSVMRFTNSGELDASFGNGGVAAAAGDVNSVPVFQKDGRILVVTSAGINRFWP